MKMKKMLAAVLTVSMLSVLALTGCGDKESDQPASSDTVKGYIFEADGVEVAVDTDVTAVVDKLGEPDSYFEEPSCAGQGLTKIYTYAGFQIYTYEKDKTDLIERIVLMDDTVATPEGVDLSMAKDDVIDAYGEDHTGTDNTIVYEKGGMKLSFVLDGDAVISIEYISGSVA